MTGGGRQSCQHPPPPDTQTTKERESAANIQTFNQKFRRCKKEEEKRKAKKENFSTYSERDSFEKPKSEQKRELQKKTST